MPPAPHIGAPAPRPGDEGKRGRGDGDANAGGKAIRVRLPLRDEPATQAAQEQSTVPPRSEVRFQNLAFPHCKRKNTKTQNFTKESC